MVAPLDVDMALLFQLVHDEMGAVAAVVDVADHVQPVDDGVLHQMAHGDDEAVGGVGLDDGVDDLPEVVLLVEVLAAGGHELADDVLVLLGQHAAHLGAGILGGGDLADGDELLERDGVPLRREHAPVAHVAQLALRVVDQRGQRVAVGGGDIVAQRLVDLAAHRAGGVAQDVAQALILAVDVADIVLGPLGEVQNRAEIDDLGGDRLGGGIDLGQGFQIADGFLVKARFRHGLLLFC